MLTNVKDVDAATLPFNQELDFGVADINYDLEELLSHAALQLLQRL